jgi:DUF1365 family protein
MAYLDIDRIPELMNASRLTSYNRWNWASYCERDHFGDPQLSLRERISRSAESHGTSRPEGTTFLLTHLRYLGYNFNPVSFFYNHDNRDKLISVMAEVNNTFGETQNYWLSSECEVPAGENKKYRFRKSFHVSPFMKMGQEYEWTLTPPSDRLICQSASFEDGEVVFDSTLKLERREWCAAELRRALTRFPWVTMKVIAAIHWQAFQLLLRRVPVVTHPGNGHFEPANTRHWGASWPTD